MKELYKSQPYLSIPVLAEHQYGLINSLYQKSLETWLNQLKLVWLVLILDLMAVHFYAEIRDQLKKKGRMISVNDLWIAALAIQHQLPILSKDCCFDCMMASNVLDGSKMIRSLQQVKE